LSLSFLSQENEAKKSKADQRRLQEQQQRLQKEDEIKAKRRELADLLAAKKELTEKLKKSMSCSGFVCSVALLSPFRCISLLAQKYMTFLQSVHDNYSSEYPDIDSIKKRYDLLVDNVNKSKRKLDDITRLMEQERIAKNEFKKVRFVSTVLCSLFCSGVF
jgi:predicted ribosome quality control (RQC) complex YloA/Tae2 family protein